jgi:outer membrane protein OmpA-like peptidoglycan-associated protein
MEFLVQNTAIAIEVSGHTDNTGNEKLNQTLSENRAKTVYNYLIKNGINPLRLSFKGFGQNQPIATNATEEGRKQNRRTEFKITRK